MTTLNDRRWLVTTILATLIVAVATFLPWLIFEGGMNATGTGFDTHMTLIGITLPNWVVLAECVIIAVYAVMQYLEIATRKSLVPVVFSGLALFQAGALLVLGISGIPAKPTVNTDIDPNTFQGAYGRAFADQINQNSITVHVGIGAVVAVVCTAWLLLAAIRYRIASPNSTIRTVIRSYTEPDI